MVFTGKINDYKSEMWGTWVYEDQEGDENVEANFWSFQLGEPVQGVMRTKFNDTDEWYEDRIQLDLKKKIIEPGIGLEEKDLFEEFYAIDAVDQAALCFFIRRPDCSFL